MKTIRLGRTNLSVSRIGIGGIHYPPYAGRTFIKLGGCITDLKYNR
jgi:aryl-alcohol dehydrogenase-like predicted oxidoreductase